MVEDDASLAGVGNWKRRVSYWNLDSYFKRVRRISKVETQKMDDFIFDDCLFSSLYVRLCKRADGPINSRLANDFFILTRSRVLLLVMTFGIVKV